MTIAIINQWIGTIDVLDLTEDEKKKLMEADDEDDISTFDVLYSTAWDIAVAHGYDIQESGITLLAGDDITVYYENSDNTMRL